MNTNRYLSWQQHLTSSRSFRLFWVFWGLYSILAVFAVGFYLLAIGQVRVVVLAMASFVLARLILSPLIYLIYKKQRPYQILKFAPIQSILFSKSTTRANAFPSDHAISFASIATIIFFFFPSLGIVLAAVALFNSIGRIILGYHFTYQIIAGWLLGIISAFLIINFLAAFVN